MGPLRKGAVSDLYALISISGAQDERLERIEGIIERLRGSEYSDEAVEWMENKLKSTLSYRISKATDPARVSNFARVFDEELFLKRSGLSVTSGQRKELSRVYLAFLDSFRSGP